MRRAERAAVKCQILNRQFDSPACHTRVEPMQCGAQAWYQHNFMQRLAPQHTAPARLFVKSVDGLVTESGEQGNGRLLYQGVFGVVAHALYLMLFQGGRWSKVIGQGQSLARTLLRSSLRTTRAGASPARTLYDWRTTRAGASPARTLYGASQTAS